MAPGSTVVVVSDATTVEPALAGVTRGLQNETVEVRAGDTTDRRLIDSLDPRSFNHIIVLCSDTLEPQTADSRTLITLLHLRDIASRSGHDFSIMSEMLDLRNRALAEVTQADDFIVSDRMTSLLLSQVVGEQAPARRCSTTCSIPAGPRSTCGRRASTSRRVRR